MNELTEFTKKLIALQYITIPWSLLLGSCRKYVL